MAKQKIILFGASGFIGHNLANAWLNNDSFELLTPSSMECNLYDQDQVSEYLVSEQPDFIVHVAYNGVNAHTGYDSQQMWGNLKMNETILLGAKELQSLKKVFFFGSGLEYGPSDAPITEETVLLPQSPYATTKVLQTFLSLEIARQYDLPLVIFRPFNLFGEYDTKSLVYYLIASALKGSEITTTKGEQQRDYLYIGDLVTMVTLAIEHSEKLENLQPYNLASGQSIAIKDLVRNILDELDYQGEVHTKPYGKQETWYQVADVSKLKSVIESFELVSIDEGIRRTIDWVRSTI